MGGQGGAAPCGVAQTLALTPRGLLGLLKCTLQAWLDDRAPTMGAALAYYTLFAMAPLLLIVISVAGAVFGAEAAGAEILGQLNGLLGFAGAAVVASLLESVPRHDQTVSGTVVGSVLLLVAATTVFAELKDALDRICRVPARPGGAAHGNAWWLLLRTHVASFGLILGIGFLLLVSLAVSAALAAALFAMIYKLIPRARIGWPDVWLGSAMTALLFTLGKAAIGAYIGSSGVATGFGAASSIVVLLIWVYWSAQVFLLGAEFTWVFAHQCGSRREAQAA